ncbi:HlyD family type I secretion periplasmic adaptor subunit [Chelativorans salis]|uniref:Membrane fusion protein (MFP) family protein n=1 Tax=Chelativorans salis TaxID=2978478 RepID=A0ABT2LQA0_9HYPH|nr:HlyD family type I secretion periplasmic adaptor subunit [Chelativorans sp. EGI FJ00035]MCT7375558.1 HlyD family type I secretion periplasmic adaptor subunit [Chelativorans sp. EGI FJ00035]
MELEFLPGHLEILERSPSRVGRLVALAIMVLCTLALLWSIFGKIDVIASAPGRIIASQYSKVVQAPELGEISSIHASDGQSVTRGDILVELVPISAEAEAERLDAQVEFSILEITRLEALLTDDPGSFDPPKGIAPAKVARVRERLMSAYQEQQAEEETFTAQLAHNTVQQEAAQRDIVELEMLLSNMRERYEGREELFKKGHFPRLKLLELKEQLLSRERELLAKRSELEVLKTDVKTLESQRQQQRTERRRTLMEQLDQERRKLVDLRQEHIKAKERARHLTIRAPVDGVVQQLAVHTIGGIVTAGQELMMVVPDEAALEAEVKVLNKDIGFLLPGQPVELKIESFPYTRYGTVKGKILHVSRDSVTDEQLGLIYPAHIRLSARAIAVDGKDVLLATGMQVTAEIKTDSRRVIDYLLSPLMDHQHNAMRER